MRLSEGAYGKAWLEHFGPSERQVVAGLMDKMLLVGRESFASGMRTLLDQISKTDAGQDIKLAVYAERPIKKVFGKIPAYFNNSRSGRAVGAGRPPIEVDPRSQEVGSEGIGAQLITAYSRAHPASAFSHPGPDKMRKEKVRKIVIVTDFVGSGMRIYDMLESFRYVATLRSWRSYGLLEFAVLAYSGSVFGLDQLRRHKLKPDVRIFTGCPTIETSFRSAQRAEIHNVLRRFPPGHAHPFGWDGWGWGGSGALIAFAHGCPNNVPPIFHSRAAGWRPLFPGRTTEVAAEDFPTNPDDVVGQRSQDLLHITNARQALSSLESRRWISTMLVLTAVSTGARSIEEISAPTGLNMEEVKTVVGFSKVALWLTDSGKLTKLGKQELVRLRRRGRRKPILPSASQSFYYPTQLRAL